jgi:Uncharacterized protein conserved in bacteria
MIGQALKWPAFFNHHLPIIDHQESNRMFDGVTLNHEQQQEAAERIHALMAKGMSSGEAIMQVANEIRSQAAQAAQASASEE